MTNANESVGGLHYIPNLCRLHPSIAVKVFPQLNEEMMTVLLVVTAGFLFARVALRSQESVLRVLTLFL
jgi:hypothetical protein